MNSSRISAWINYLTVGLKAYITPKTSVINPTTVVGLAIAFEKRDKSSMETTFQLVYVCIFNSSITYINLSGVAFLGPISCIIML